MKWRRYLIPNNVNYFRFQSPSWFYHAYVIVCQKWHCSTYVHYFLRPWKHVCCLWFRAPPRHHLDYHSGVDMFHVVVCLFRRVSGHLISLAASLAIENYLPSVIQPYKKAVLPQGNRAMLQVFFSVEVRQQHSLQV